MAKILKGPLGFVKIAFFMFLTAAAAGGLYYFATPNESLLYEVSAEKELGKIHHAILTNNSSSAMNVIQTVLDQKARVHLDIYSMQSPGRETLTSRDMSGFQLLNYISGILGHAKNYSFESKIIQPASSQDRESGIVQFSSVFQADALSEWGRQIIGHYAMTSLCNTVIINAGKSERSTLNDGILDPTRLGNLTCRVKVRYTPAAKLPAY